MPFPDAFGNSLYGGRLSAFDRQDPFGRDPYQSRLLSYPERRPRFDPVLHGGQDRCKSLSPEQVRAFEEDGFLVLENFFDSSRISAWSEEAENLSRNPDLARGEEVVTESVDNVVRSIFRIHKYSPIFSRLARDPALMDIVRFILADDIYLHQSRVNYKPAFNGREFYWHSDFETWHVEDGMPRMRAVSVSITLSENNVFNGPLMLIPGSHKTYVSCVGQTPDKHYKKSLRRQEYGVPDDISLSELVEKGGVVAPTGPVGTTVIFDCNTMHGSNGNISPFPRTNVFFVYNACSNALVAPFSGQEPRPDFISNRNFSPLTPAG